MLLGFTTNSRIAGYNDEPTDNVMSFERYLTKRSIDRLLKCFHLGTIDHMGNGSLCSNLKH